MAPTPPALSLVRAPGARSGERPRSGHRYFILKNLHVFCYMEQLGVAHPDRPSFGSDAMAKNRVDQLFDEAGTRIAADLATDGAPETMPIKGVCVLLGYSLSHTRRLIAAGKLECPVPGHVSAESLARLVKEKVAANRYNIERTKFIAERAEIARMKREKMAASLADVDDIREQWAALSATIRERVMQVPAEIAPLAGTFQGTAHCETILRDHLERALIELSESPLEKVRA